MRRVLVVITARPSYSRIYSVLKALKERTDVDLQVVACASAVITRFGRIADQIKADGLPLVAEVSSVVEEDSLANSALSAGVLLTQLAGTLERLKPDVVVTIADRHETLATAIAASYQHIPLCHIQGGEVTGSIDDKVRNAVTQLADIHCVATDRAAANVHEALRFEGKPVTQWRGMIERTGYGTSTVEVSGRAVHVTGCPSIDLAAEALRQGPLHLADVIVLQHSVTNEYDQAADQMRATVEAVGRDAKYFWPGEDAGGTQMAKVLRLAGINPIRNMPPVQFLRALLGAKVLVGNSSVGIRECSYLGVPVVNVGTRQQGRERAGNAADAIHHRDDIRAMVAATLRARRPERSTLYGDGHAGERIASILIGEAQEAAA